MQSLHTRNFRIGILISFCAALYLLLSCWFIGRVRFFLLLNTDGGPVADMFFRYWTYLGDGIAWVIVVILVFIYRKQYLPMIFSAILVSTLITQVTKNYIFPNEPRPMFGLIDSNKIHTVRGVELYTVNSFPSGHTGTAFTIFLLACLLIRNRWVIPAGFCYALLVGYSRIYLAEHFPLDVGAGIITGILTVLLSVDIQKRWALRHRK